MDFMRRAAIAAATLAFTGLLATGAHADSAMDQLKRAQHQSGEVTFDGARPPQQAQPNRPAPRPVVTQSSPQRPQQPNRSSSTKRR